jgi:hypothetical protein
LTLLPPPSASPAPVLPTAGRVTAEAILAELQARGMVVAAPPLVLTLSDLWTWTQRRECADPRNDRAHLPALREALAGLDVGLRPSGERTGTVAEIAQDCADLAVWLEGRDALRSAVGYAEAAAGLEPESAARALVVARLARELGCLPAAGAWGVWAMRLAGRGHDPVARAGALVELGHLSATRQHYAEAGRLFALARRFALSRHLPREEGEALRGLALLKYGHRRDGEALALFAEAVRAYGPGSLGVDDLGHMVTGLWLDEREYRGAALLGRVLLDRPCHPHYALSLAGMLARAAAALGWEMTYESACQRALVSLGHLSSDFPCAPPLLDLARAHGALGSWPRAELTAHMAKQYAGRTGDDEATHLAKRIIAASLRQKMPKRLRADLFPDQTEEDVPEGKDYPVGHPVRKLVKCFRASVSATVTRDG